MILPLVKADGFTLKKQATTNGGEYAGTCPWCGGNDRFRIWPNKDRYWCRGCDKTGDAIQYLRDFRRLSYQEACLFVGREPGPQKDNFCNGGITATAQWEPRDTNVPSEQWQSRARVFHDGAIDCLWSKQGETIRAWLHAQKGLTDATIREAGLGYNPSDIYEPGATWGLDPIVKDDGTEKKQWIPAGIVIPSLISGAAHRLRIRRDDLGDGSRYVIVSGSSSAPMAWGKDKGTAVIVESELDGLLLNQEAGDLCHVVAMGTATAKPNKETNHLLKSMPVILVSLDTDDAGAKAAWGFWPNTFGTKARRWPCLKGKDPSEARLNGLDLRKWIIAGLFETEERFERFCIITVDGGLSDREALTALTDI